VDVDVREKIKISSLYFSHEREVFYRDGLWLAYAPFMALKPEEKVERRCIRCRSIGDIICRGVVLSEANMLEDIITEVATARITERAHRQMINVLKQPWNSENVKVIFKPSATMEKVFNLEQCR
jgi:3'-phosphoadenosine 5'-phosphosulfate sulfotransferase (PAPS reductase)/FAD synthetase